MPQDIEFTITTTPEAAVRARINEGGSPPYNPPAPGRRTTCSRCGHASGRHLLHPRRAAAAQWRRTQAGTHLDAAGNLGRVGQISALARGNLGFWHNGDKAAVELMMKRLQRQGGPSRGRPSPGLVTSANSSPSSVALKSDMRHHGCAGAGWGSARVPGSPWMEPAQNRRGGAGR